MEKKETITRINGNGKSYTSEVPDLVILHYMSDLSLKFIKDNTGLDFQLGNFGNFYAKATTFNQIAALVTLYSFKTYPAGKKLLLKICHSNEF